MSISSPHGASNLSRAHSGENEELEPEPDRDPGVRRADRRKRTANLGVRECSVVLGFARGFGKRFRKSFVSGIVFAIAHHDRPVHSDTQELANPLDRRRCIFHDRLEQGGELLKQDARDEPVPRARG